MNEQDILDKTQNLPPQERAAALAHWVYMMTSQKAKDWDARVPIDWNSLSAEARQFNVDSVETWARAAQVLEAWLEAVRAHQKSLGS